MEKEMAAHPSSLAAAPTQGPRSSISAPRGQLLGRASLSRARSFLAGAGRL